MLTVIPATGGDGIVTHHRIRDQRLLFNIVVREAAVVVHPVQ